MKHEFIALTVSKTALTVHFRCVGPQEAWIRFGTMRVPIADVEPETIAELGMARLRLQQQQDAQQEMLY